MTKEDFVEKNPYLVYSDDPAVSYDSDSSDGESSIVVFTLDENGKSSITFDEIKGAMQNGKAVYLYIPDYYGDLIFAQIASININDDYVSLAVLVEGDVTVWTLTKGTGGYVYFEW